MLTRTTPRLVLPPSTSLLLPCLLVCKGPADADWSTLNVTDYTPDEVRMPSDRSLDDAILALTKKRDAWQRQPQFLDHTFDIVHHPRGWTHV